MSKRQNLVLIPLIIFMLTQVDIIKGQNATSPLAETIKGETTQVCDSLYTVVIFCKNTGCRACYETLGEYLQLFVPRKNIGVTYWIDEGENRSLRRKAYTQINGIFEMPGKVVFTPFNLNEADKQLNQRFCIPDRFLHPADCPSLALINRQSGTAHFYATNDIIDYCPIISIKSSFKEILIDFLSGYIYNSSVNNKRQVKGRNSN